MIRNNRTRIILFALAIGMFGLALGGALVQAFAPSQSFPVVPSVPQVGPNGSSGALTIGLGNRKDSMDETVLLLSTSEGSASFDPNFCRVVEYYGVFCQTVAIDRVELTDSILRNKTGNYFKLAAVSPTLLTGNGKLLDGGKISTLKSAIAAGLNLLVSVQQDMPDGGPLALLSDGIISGVTKIQASRRDWRVSNAAPNVTQVFSGIVVSCDSAPIRDFGFGISRAASVSTFISATDSAGAEHPVFAQFKLGAGSIFVNGGEQTAMLNQGKARLAQIYYAPCHFSEVVPLMLTVRHVLGDRVWHGVQQYANLTIDDPPLTDRDLNYAGLLQEMKAHNFHTTIAFVPKNLDKTQPAVARLFLENPDQYSLVQHGNNHDGYEFYRYSVSEADTLDGQKYPARPLAQQERNIVEGLARMEEHQKLTGIPFDRIMVFPYGISPEPTLVMLKKYNYLATFNGQGVPLDAVVPSRWDFEMYPAAMDFGNFPVLLRRPPGTYGPFRPQIQPFIFDLFLGKPALYYSHPYSDQLFGGGIDAFDIVADTMNQLPGKVEWHNLGYIIKHLYLERANSDGSVDVQMYSNDLIITPTRQGGVTYHIAKEENLNVPIRRLTVNGQEFPYYIEQGMLKLDAVAPKDGASMEVVIEYGD